jgi:predicted Zn finger-like uncharacterized protein
VATRCPKCSFPANLAIDELGETGRMVRCSRCGTAWLAREVLDDPYGERPQAYLPPALRQRPVIDGIIIDNIGRGFERLPPDVQKARGMAPRRRPFGRYGLHSLAALALALGVAAGAVTLRAPIVAALPEFAGLDSLMAETSGLALQGVASKTLRIHGQTGLFVEGEIVNRSSEEKMVPAVKFSLRGADGATLYSWLVEPTAMRLAAGATVGFRSVLGSTPAGARDVAVSFDRRQQIGMR